MRQRMNQRGGAGTILLVFVFGIVLGVAGGITPRFYGVDPMSWIKPPEAAAASDEKSAEKPIPGLELKETELHSLIADVKKRTSTLEDREKPLRAREQNIEQQQVALETLKTQIEQAEQAIRKRVIEIKADELQNLKDRAKTLGIMEPTNASSLLAAMCATPPPSDPDLAAKILFTMTVKQSAAIFDTMTATEATPETKKLAADLQVKLLKLRLEAAPKKAGGG